MVIRAQIEKMKKRLQITLNGTKFAGCDMVAVAARPGGAESMAAGETTNTDSDTRPAPSRGSTGLAGMCPPVGAPPAAASKTAPLAYNSWHAATGLERSYSTR